MKKIIVGTLVGMTLGLTVLTSCMKKLDNLSSEASIIPSGRSSQNSQSNPFDYLYRGGAVLGGLIVLGSNWYGIGKLEEHSESESRNTS